MQRQFHWDKVSILTRLPVFRSVVSEKLNLPNDAVIGALALEISSLLCSYLTYYFTVHLHSVFRLSG